MTALICLLIVVVASLVARCSRSLATMTPSVAAVLMVTATKERERKRIEERSHNARTDCGRSRSPERTRKFRCRYRYSLRGDFNADAGNVALDSAHEALSYAEYCKFKTDKKICSFVYYLPVFHFILSFAGLYCKQFNSFSLRRLGLMISK